MFPDLDFFSIGVAIKDSSGSVLATLSKPFTCTFSLESVEVLALREGLVLATQLGFKVSWAEVNAVNVAAGIDNIPFHRSKSNLLRILLIGREIDSGKEEELSEEEAVAVVFDPILVKNQQRVSFSFDSYVILFWHVKEGVLTKVARSKWSLAIALNHNGQPMNC
ncbi:hypothetical protein QYF36_017413 [Acer negundo]|nr:hypothetical protein QYF36_017413 [Acer negundo]